MFSKLRTAIIKIILIFLFIQGNAFALDPSTHEAINLHITNSTMNGFSLDQYLKSNLDFSQGIGEEFDEERVDAWLELGGLYEDIPPWDLPDSWGLPYLRSVNHFHNPTTDQGYIGFWGTGIMSGMSSTQWMLLPQNTQSSSCYLGCYSWHDVRDYYHKALTESDQNTRDTNFKETFRGLGQLMHLIQDVSVPAHTREDGHFFYNYEKWVRDETDISTYNPVFFSSAINDIASFIDTDQYSGTNPDITDSTNIGLSEYVNANFFSNDTNTIESTSFTYPQITEDTDIVEKEFVNNNVPLADTYNRQYYKKNYDGETYGVDGTGYLLSGVDYFEYYRRSLNPLGAQKLIAPLLDYNVYEDYAFLLIPRAIGYSAGLLNYFFRGEIEVIQVPNSNNIKIKNNSSEVMDGTFTLYYDATDGRRYPVPNASWTLPPLYAGDTSNELSFTEPTDIAEGKQYILVFQGMLGSESNAVVGKVLSGAGGCDFPIVDTCSVPCSDFLLRCQADDWHKVGFLHKTSNPDDWDVYSWDFGDGEFFVGDKTDAFSLTHTYAEAGEYTVSLTVGIDVITTFQNGIPQPGGEHKIGSSSISNAGAYANWVAASPTISYWEEIRWDVQAIHNWMGTKSWKYESMIPIYRSYVDSRIIFAGIDFRGFNLPLAKLW